MKVAVVWTAVLCGLATAFASTRHRSDRGPNLAFRPASHAPWTHARARTSESQSSSPNGVPNPVADPGAVVLAANGSIRVTVLTERLVRVEKRGAAPNATFVDTPTLSFVNRK